MMLQVMVQQQQQFLAYAMVKEGLKNVAAGANPISIKLGMEKATQYLVMQINEFAQPVEDIQSIQASSFNFSW